jgi:hypothetical protein
MSERCPICDQEECHHTPDEKELVKRRAEVIVLEKAIDGWRSVNRSLSSKLSAAEKERDELREKLEEVIRIATLGMAFAPKGPVRPNLAPMFYHTLNYESEVITQKIIDDAREALQAIALKGKGKV